MLKRLRERFENWMARRAETDFQRGYREHVQRADAALLPLSQIGKGTADAILLGRRPGTLTVTVGAETVTLDPMDSTPKFLRDRAKCDELLAKIAQG